METQTSRRLCDGSLLAVYMSSQMSWTDRQPTSSSAKPCGLMVPFPTYRSSHPLGVFTQVEVTAILIHPQLRCRLRGTLQVHQLCRDYIGQLTDRAPAAGPCWRLIGDREAKLGTSGGASHVSIRYHPLKIRRSSAESTLCAPSQLIESCHWGPLPLHRASSMIAHHICTATVIVMRLVSII
jgi:hypothetical protein